MLNVSNLDTARCYRRRRLTQLVLVQSTILPTDSDYLSPDRPMQLSRVLVAVVTRW